MQAGNVADNWDSVVPPFIPSLTVDVFLIKICLMESYLSYIVSLSFCFYYYFKSTR